MCNLYNKGIQIKKRIFRPHELWSFSVFVGFNVDIMIKSIILRTKKDWIGIWIN